MVAVSNGVNMHMLIINIHSVFFEPHFLSVCLKFRCLKILDLLWPLLPLATTCGGGGEGGGSDGRVSAITKREIHTVSCVLLTVLSLWSHSQTAWEWDWSCYIVHATFVCALSCPLDC